jgi:hypothetical protein
MNSFPVSIEGRCRSKRRAAPFDPRSGAEAGAAAASRHRLAAPPLRRIDALQVRSAAVPGRIAARDQEAAALRALVVRGVRGRERLVLSNCGPRLG